VIDHVYGFSGDRNKSVCYFGKDNNQIVFPAAALGVVQDLSTRTQRFFGGCEKEKDAEKYQANFPYHQDDITSLSMAGGESRNIIATGECGKQSSVHVWDSNSMSSVARFELGSKAKGVAALSISPCQRYVAAVDQSNDHTMYIYNVQRKKMLLTLPAGSDAIFNIQWSKKPNDLKFVAVSTRALQFWNPADASKKLFKSGTFGTKFNQTKFNNATFDENGVCYSAGANGGVYVWDQKQELGLVLKAHAGECTAVACSQGTLVSTGKDDMLSIFSSNQGEYEFQRQIPLNTFYYASSLDLLNGKILIGHDNGRI
jgi:WD40 repeat protein